MIRLEDTKILTITLKCEEKQVLFVLIANDGTVNRLGDGSYECEDKNLYIGISTNNLFEKTKQFVTQEMSECVGELYTCNEIKGKKCEMTIIYTGDNFETGVRFVYGDLSERPPMIFRDLVKKAVEYTDPWWGEQKRISKKQSTKPNWKFW